MRVALLHPSYWPEVRRGSERLLHDVAAGLASRGHDVTLLTSHAGRTSVSEEEGFTVVRNYRPPAALLRRSAERYLTHAPAAAWRLLRGSFDVAHAFYSVDAWAAVRARRLGGPPVVFSVNGILTRKYLVERRFRLSIFLEAAAGAAVRTVLSKAASTPFRRYLLHEPQVVPGGLFADRFRTGQERDPRPTLICAASLNDPYKRGRLLLDAFESLRELRPDAKLLLAGRSDPTFDRVALKLPAGAEWIDGDRTDVLARAYASAWASVLPSVGEAFGLTLLESLAAGTPAVAARSGGCPDILSSESVGRLFEPDSKDDLLRAMHEALELGAANGTVTACREHARRYDWSTVLPSYESLYEQALGAVGQVGGR